MTISQEQNYAMPVIDPETLLDYQRRGLLRSERHPTLPLTVWCYSRRCQYEQRWDDVTRSVRGLVMHDDGRLVGRGLPKMMHFDPSLVPVAEAYTAFDKIDGTLIHVTEFEGALLAWTKASFRSEQISSALEHLQGWMPTPGTTALFEAVFPWNRIVVDYNGFSGLVLLGEVEHETGVDSTPPDVVAVRTGWSGETPVERQMHTKWAADLCANPENGYGREGFVFVWPRSDGPSLRLKMKFAQYIRLHRMLSNLTEKTVVEAYNGESDEWESFLAAIPDELDERVREVQSRIEEHVGASISLAKAALEPVGGLESRKAVADHLATLEPLTRLLAWLLYDGKDSAAHHAAVRSFPASSAPLVAGVSDVED